MSCGFEGMLLALQLAKETVKPVATQSPWINAVCNCCFPSESAQLRCLAEQAAAQEKADAEHNEKVGEFRAIMHMCEKGVRQ